MNLDSCISLQAHANDTPVDGAQVKMHDLPITVEHPRGSVRKLHDDKGKVVYRKHMHFAYGFFNGTKGRDGDEVDCFVGPMKDAKEVFVVHMKDLGPVKAEREDEDKCFIGFQSADAAKAAFLMHYPEHFYDGMTALPVEAFKEKMATATLPHMKKKITADATGGIGIVGDPAVEENLRRMPKSPMEAAGVSVSWGVRSTLIRMLHAAARRGSEILQAAGVKKCPHCSSKKIMLSPVQLKMSSCGRMAMCRACGKNFSACGKPMKAEARPKCPKCGSIRYGTMQGGGRKCSACGEKWHPQKMAGKIAAGGPGSGRHPGEPHEWRTDGDAKKLICNKCYKRTTVKRVENADKASKTAKLLRVIRERDDGEIGK